MIVTLLVVSVTSQMKINFDEHQSFFIHCSCKVQKQKAIEVR